MQQQHIWWHSNPNVVTSTLCWPCITGCLSHSRLICFHSTYLNCLLGNITYHGSLRSNQQNVLVVPRSYWVTFGDRRFRIAGPVQWNNLPTEMMNCDTYKTTKYFTSSTIARNGIILHILVHLVHIHIVSPFGCHTSLNIEFNMGAADILAIIIIHPWCHFKKNVNIATTCWLKSTKYFDLRILLIICKEWKWKMHVGWERVPTATPFPP